MDLTTHLADFPLFGSIIQVTTRVGSTLIIVFIMFSPILLGFGFFFQWALGTTETFDTTWKVILKIIAMSTGEIEVESFSKNRTLIEFDAGINFALASRRLWNLKEWQVTIII